MPEELYTSAWDKASSLQYVKLHFTIEFDGDYSLPVNKVSALRGGVGEMLLRSNCVMDRECERCCFRSECLVQRIMYSEMRIHPVFMTRGDSAGYVYECEDYRDQVCVGDRLGFNLILFGRAIVYFNQYLYAIAALGQSGIGADKALFHIISVTNSRKQEILDGSSVLMSRYEILTIAEYVTYRLKKIAASAIPQEISIRFRSPLYLKYDGKFQTEFNMDALIASMIRRIYILCCYDGIDINMDDIRPETLPEIVYQEHYPVQVDRYSYRKDQHMSLRGIEGRLTLSDITEDVLRLLLYGELVHIGKNTSFGFGRYRIID